jgi:hypothetical protein
MPLTDEEKAQLQELAGKLDAGDDLGDLPFVHKAVLKGRLSDKDRARQQLEAQHQAELAELQTKHAEAKAQLKGYEDKGKSDDDKLKELLQGYETKIEAQDKRYEAERTARKAEFLRSRLQSLLGTSPMPPAQINHALVAAQHDLSPTVTDNDGKLSLTIMQDGIPAEKPSEVFAGWWEKQKHLHAARGNQLPPPGGGTPPGDAPPKDPLEGMTPEQQLAYALSGGR